MPTEFFFTLVMNLLAVKPSSEELANAKDWVQSSLISDTGALPFSFVYGGHPSNELLKSWKVDKVSEKIDENRSKHTLTYSDPLSGLILSCIAVEYKDFPTIEWTLYFKNTGSIDTPIIENIQALDIRLKYEADVNAILHHFAGSQANRSDYAPLETILSPGSQKRISAAGGRPTNTDMSYFNLECDNGGIVIVIGWPGQWASEFTRDEKGEVKITAGQELTHFKLLPGEEVRSPLIVLQFYKGDWIRAQNIWRRWMMSYNIPKPNGELPKPMLLASSSRAYEEMIKADEEKQIMFIDRYIEEGLKIDYWWMDAGWYIQQNGWPQVGTWEVDPKRFPRGFKPISDHAHKNAIKILVWFEPERVASGTWLTENHPEWILGGANGGLLNLGNSDAWNWLVNHIDKLLTDNGIDLYRQDFNMDPLNYWRSNDAEDRQGITEIKHIVGYLSYWDELRKRHPNMLIDSCASGGRRNDLETMRRAVPLWRSDYAYEPIGHQCMTYGISFWIPFHGTGTVATVDAPYYGSGYTHVQPYAFWSNSAPSLACGFDVRVKEIDYNLLRKIFSQWREISHFYYGDFYPLTPYSQDSSVWIAWQFNEPEAGNGMIQAFRRQDSMEESANFRLNEIETEAKYIFTDLDGNSFVLTGHELVNEGFNIKIQEKPGHTIFIYKKIDD